MTLPKTPAVAVEAAPAATAGPTRYPVAVFALGGPCAVCGHPADSLVIYNDSRQVWHQTGFGPPCTLPNPDAKAVS